MKIRFYLADKSAQKTSIVLTIRQGTTGKNLKTLRIGTGLTVNPDTWDFGQERMRRNFTDTSRLNRTLDELQHKVSDLADFAERVLKTDPLAYIKDQLSESAKQDQKALQEVSAPAQSLLQHFDTFITERSVFDATSTIKRYRVTYNHLKTFLGMKGISFGFDDVTKEFYNRLIDYYFNVAGLTNNTVGRHVEAFKCFLHAATEKGINTNSQYRKLFRRADFERDATTIALTDAELIRMEELDLTDNLRLDHVRDLFIIGCYTSLRFSDVAQIRAEHIKEGFIRIHVTKTTKALAIPITPRLARVLAKYHPHYKFVPISSQKMNDYIKEVGKLAGIDEMVEIVRFRGGEKLAEVKPKYEALSTHAARRTCITLSLQKGVQAELVMKVSGHKDSRSFRKYIKHADEYLKDEMSKAWR